MDSSMPVELATRHRKAHQTDPHAGSRGSDLAMGVKAAPETYRSSMPPATSYQRWQTFQPSPHVHH
jgi:hypothetical protein